MCIEVSSFVSCYRNILVMNEISMSTSSLALGDGYTVDNAHKLSLLNFLLSFLLVLHDCGAIGLFSYSTMNPSTRPVKQAVPKEAGTLSTSHLNKRLDPGEPEIPQGAHVTGCGCELRQRQPDVCIRESAKYVYIIYLSISVGMRPSRWNPQRVYLIKQESS